MKTKDYKQLIMDRIDHNASDFLADLATEIQEEPMTIYEASKLIHRTNVILHTLRLERAMIEATYEGQSIEDDEDFESWDVDDDNEDPTDEEIEIPFTVHPVPGTTFKDWIEKLTSETGAKVTVVDMRVKDENDD